MLENYEHLMAKPSKDGDAKLKGLNSCEYASQLPQHTALGVFVVFRHKTLPMRVNGSVLHDPV